MPTSPGDRLETLMRSVGHTRKSLAVALGVHVNSVSGWITGKITEPRDPALRTRLAEEIGEDVYATWVDPGDGRDIVKLEDVPNDVFADEILRRMGIRRGRTPFVINDSETIRGEMDGPVGGSGGSSA